MREIWMMQPRFDKRTGSTPFSLVEQPRFRAAFDFMRLRADVGEVDVVLADWWQEFSQASDAVRDDLVDGAARTSSGPRRVRAGPAAGAAKRRAATAAAASGGPPPPRRRRRRRAADDEPPSDESRGRQARAAQAPPPPAQAGEPAARREQPEPRRRTAAARGVRRPRRQPRRPRRSSTRPSPRSAACPRRASSRAPRSTSRHRSMPSAPDYLNAVGGCATDARAAGPAGALQAIEQRPADRGRPATRRARSTSTCSRTAPGRWPRRS